MPNGAHLLNAYEAECTNLLNAYDAKLQQEESITLEAYIFVTDREIGKSKEVFGVALHLFFTKFLGSWVMNQPWHICGVMHSEGRRILASNAFRRYVHLVFHAAKG